MSRAAALVLPTLMALGACTQQPAERIPVPERVVFAIGAHPSSILVRTAAREGFFAEQGIEAVLQPQPSERAALAAVLADEADLAQPAETPLVLAALEGRRFSIVAGVETSKQSNAIVARRDRGVAGPRDLQGKTVGAPLGTNAHFFLDAYLQIHGIDPEKVAVRDVKAPALAAALARGEIDAGSCWTPYVQQMAATLGKEAVVLADPQVYSESISLVGARLVWERPQTVVRVLRALLRAEGFVCENPAAARALLADFSGMGLPLATEVWGDYDFALRLEQSLMLSLEDQARWAIGGRLTSAAEVPNFLEYFWVDGLLAVKPEAVRVVR